MNEYDAPPPAEIPQARYAPGYEAASPASGPAARKAKPWNIPVGAVVVGIVGGGVLGALLAWGIIGIVNWRRDAAAQAEQRAAEAEAQRIMEEDANRKAAEGNSDWRKWAEGRSP